MIKGPRQKRAIEALLKHPKIPVKDLGPVIGALNPRQIIMLLRRQGFKNIILTERITVIDRDRRKCSPGVYYIPDRLKPVARAALEDAPATSLTEAQDQIIQTHDNKAGKKNAII